MHKSHFQAGGKPADTALASSGYALTKSTIEAFPGRLRLRSMRERAERIGGTRIRVKVPLNVQAATDASVGN